MINFEKFDNIIPLTTQELLDIEGGKKSHWYQPIIDFGQGFLDAF